jgi:hypothetical protein
MSKCYLIILCLVLLNITCSTATADKVITHETFENGFSDYWYRAMNNYTYSGNPSTNYSVSPSHAYRFELHNTDVPFEDGMRSELEGPAEPPLQERIYNFSIYLPEGGTEDYTIDAPGAGEVIVQWHNNPDEGEEWTRPPLALFTDTYDNGTGYYFLQRIWDEDPISTDEKLEYEGKMIEYDLGSYEEDKGRWVNWSFHVKWGWLESQNPKLEVFKDGVMILNLDGLPNTTNDTRGVNQQFGMYKWSWNERDIDAGSILTSRVIYFDDVTVTQINNITIPIFPGCTNVPTDPDNNGLYEDINGNGDIDFNDDTTYYDNVEWIETNAPVALFDYNRNEVIDFDDVIKLYDMV